MCYIAQGGIYLGVDVAWVMGGYCWINTANRLAISSRPRLGAALMMFWMMAEMLGISATDSHEHSMCEWCHTDGQYHILAGNSWGKGATVIEAAFMPSPHPTI
jgi:hypothetical protein